jgi:hypothetical protein
MKKTNRKVFVVCCATLLELGAPNVFADFVSDSTSSIAARNFYYHRNYYDGRHDLNEWAQGLALNLQSGYTEGAVGFGLDLTGWLGIKLDSAPGSSGTGILPKGASGRAPDDYSRLGATVKMRYADSTLRVGTHTPRLPLLNASDARLLPQTFNGVTLENTGIDKLLLSAGAFNRTTDRAQAGADKMTLSNSDVRNFGLGERNGVNFHYLGAEYKPLSNLTLKAYYGGLENYYKQSFLGATYTYKIDDAQYLNMDLRGFHSQDDGKQYVQQVDNTTFGGLFTYGVGANSFAIGVQRVTGDTGFAYIAGTDAYVVNSVQWGNFSSAQERSVQFKYTYDFVALGVPGLTFMTRYVTGDNIDRGSLSEGKEWERNTDIGYVIQQGPLKGLAFTVRNASYRTNFSNDLDETRVIVNYKYNLF